MAHTNIIHQVSVLPSAPQRIGPHPDSDVQYAKRSGNEKEPLVSHVT